MEDPLCHSKLVSLRIYVPFLNKMISKLDNSDNSSDNSQLSKMKSLRLLLTQAPKKLRLDNLSKCEEVLKRLHQKVEGRDIYEPRSARAAVPQTPKSPEPERRGHSREHSRDRNPREQQHREDRRRSPQQGNRPSPWQNNNQNQAQEQQQQPWSWRGEQQDRGGPPAPVQAPWQEGGPRFQQEHNSNFGLGPDPSFQGPRPIGGAGLLGPGPGAAQQGFPGPRGFQNNQGPRFCGPLMGNSNSGPRFPPGNNFNNRFQGPPGNFGAPQGNNEPPFGGGDRRPFFDGPPRDDFHQQNNLFQEAGPNNRFNNQNQNNGGGGFYNENPSSNPFQGQQGPNNQFNHGPGNHDRFQEQQGGRFQDDQRPAGFFRGHDNDRRGGRDNNSHSAQQERSQIRPLFDNSDRQHTRSPPRDRFSDNNQRSDGSRERSSHNDRSRGRGSHDRNSRERSRDHGSHNNRGSRERSSHDDHSRDRSSHNDHSRDRSHNDRGSQERRDDSRAHGSRDQDRKPARREDPRRRRVETPASPVQLDTPASPPPPVLETPASPEMMDTPESPPMVILDTPASPEMDTPASPTQETPASPTEETPQSPPSSPSSIRSAPKVIPLERKQTARSISEAAKKAKMIRLKEIDIISKPRMPMVRRPDPRRSPATSLESPASPPSSASSSPSVSTPTPPPSIPVMPVNKGPGLLPTPKARMAPRPSLPPIQLPAIPKQQPRLPMQQPQQRMLRPSGVPPPRAPGPHHYPGHFRPQPDPRNSPFQSQPRKVLTYGEYRKLKQDQERHYMRMMAAEQKRQEVSEEKATTSEAEKEKPVHTFGTTSEAKTTETAETSDNAMAKFKIPKKAKPAAVVEAAAAAAAAATAVAVVPAPQKVTARKESESTDSEPELKIAEDSGDDNAAAVVAEPSKEDSDKLSQEKQEDLDSTKKMLKNIAASLNAAAASKLMKRADNLEKEGKLSLKMLKYLLADDSSSEESEEEEVPLKKETQTKKVVKGRQKSTEKKAKAAPKAASPGTRRSRRLNVTEEEEKKAKEEEEKKKKLEEEEKVLVEDDSDSDEDRLEIADDDDEEEEDQLFIHENNEDQEVKEAKEAVPVKEVEEAKEVVKETPVKKGRGRPKKKTATEPVNVEVKVPEKLSEVEDVKQLQEAAEVTVVEEVEEEVQRKTRSGRMTRKTPSPKKPKSKTWFLQSRTGKNKTVSSILSASPPSDAPKSIKIKTESKDVDRKVFLGSDDLVFDRPEDYDPKKANKSDNAGASTGFKSRLGNLGSFFTKMQKLQEEKEEKIVEDVPKVEEKADIPVLKNSEPSDAVIIVTKSPEKYGAHMESIISRLQQDIKTVPDEAEEIKIRAQPNKQSFRSFVKTLAKDFRRKAPPKKATDWLMPAMQFESLQQPVSLPLKAKASDALSEQLSEDNISQLFKCAAASCSFTSDNGSSFLDHLETAHADDQPLGWLHCVYCNKAVVTPTKLTGHVISEHGNSAFQCRHCFHRAGNALALLMHQQVNHKGKEQGYVQCQVLDEEETSVEVVLNEGGFNCQQCSFSSREEKYLSRHLRSHPGIERQIDFVCGLCSDESFSQLAALVSHKSIHHSSANNFHCHQRIVTTSTEEIHSGDEEEEEFVSDLESECEECNMEESESSDNEENIPNYVGLFDEEGLRIGLSGKQLYRCGNTQCGFAAPDPFSFRGHLAYCPFSANQVSIQCFHCSRQLKHVATLMDHLKGHGLRRYSCSICTAFSATVAATVKAHLKAEHKVQATKVLPVDPTKNNSETDLFVVLPKNGIVPGQQQKTRVSANSNVMTLFSPGATDGLPKGSMFRVPLGCTLCDFSTKVRNNLLKHLRLHTRETVIVPPLTPINPPTEGPEKARMTILLEADTEEARSRKPMSADDLQLMPSLVPEKLRYACSDMDCNYCTIDDVMLMYHIEAIHADVPSYVCPHCPPDAAPVPFDDLSLHLRCHGDLLFKCGHCLYYHWQKRTAEEHVALEHPINKQYVRDVRKEAEQVMRSEGEEIAAAAVEEEPGPSNEDPPPPIQYTPFKCGLCDTAAETVEDIRLHCKEVHALDKQYKCGLCSYVSDAKNEVESHCSEKHDKTSCLIKVFFIDANSGTDTTLEERRLPLWSRDMPGLKHIRGILYDEEMTHVPKGRPTKVSLATASTTPVDPAVTSPEASYQPPAKKLKSMCDEADELPMSCKACGLEKKNIKALKNHIKLLHLRTGKFRCKLCQFSANIVASIHTHYKIAHAEVETEVEYEEREDVPGAVTKVFSQEFWKEDWNIPTLGERKEIIIGKKRTAAAMSDEDVISLKKKKGLKGKKGKGVKRKRKKGAAVEQVEQDEAVQSTSSTMSVETSDTSALQISANLLKRAKERFMETSPFDAMPTYKCVHCPKRSQNLDKIQQHISSEHPGKPADGDNYKLMTRDAIVDMLTMQLMGGTGGYRCFYCDDVSGGIFVLEAHFASAHPGDSLKVKGGRGAGVGGYLECMTCGHLTPGLEKSKQTIHYHEEHPLETAVNASKYVLKANTFKHLNIGAPEQKQDLSRFNGTEMSCPRPGCDFTAKALSAVNTHMRKHTQTFKCGHCGKTHSTSAEFHQHTAMSHGDKIPDQVKDPEAEAELEALKALFEARLTAVPKEENILPSPVKKIKLMNVARKSTGGGGLKKKMRNVARKSTGAAASSYHSFYGRPFVPIDLEQINTKMTMGGGFQMAISAQKMSELVNMKAVVKVHDCEKKK